MLNLPIIGRGKSPHKSRPIVYLERYMFYILRDLYVILYNVIIIQHVSRRRPRDVKSCKRSEVVTPLANLRQNKLPTRNDKEIALGKINKIIADG